MKYIEEFKSDYDYTKNIPVLKVGAIEKFSLWQKKNKSWKVIDVQIHGIDHIFVVYEK